MRIVKWISCFRWNLSYELVWRIDDAPWLDQMCLPASRHNHDNGSLIQVKPFSKIMLKIENLENIFFYMRLMCYMIVIPLKINKCSNERQRFRPRNRRKSTHLSSIALIFVLFCWTWSANIKFKSSSVSYLPSSVQYISKKVSHFSYLGLNFMGSTKCQKDTARSFGLRNRNTTWKKNSYICF